MTKQIKSVEKAIDEVVNGKSQNLEIIFNNEMELTFEDIAGYSVNSALVAVMNKSGDTIIYPLANIFNIRHYNV